MCCEPQSDHHLRMGFQPFGGCCGPHGYHHHLTPKEEKEMLESYKRDLEDEIARVEARIRKIKE